MMSPLLGTYDCNRMGVGAGAGAVVGKLHFDGRATLNFVHSTLNFVHSARLNGQFQVRW